MLYVVATPIGNLEDITLRAVRILKEVDVVAAEDTRHTKILCEKYNITTPLISYHQHSKNSKTDHILSILNDGKSVGLVTDAGTPGISDPGSPLINRAIQEGIKIVPISGPSALTAALSAAPLLKKEFVFFGFLPQKKGRKTLLESLKNEKRAMVFYESPYRIRKTLIELSLILSPDRKVVVAREITKIHEEFLRGSIDDVSRELKVEKGEFVIIVQ